MNPFEDDSLGRRTLLTVAAMVGGAVGVLTMLSVVTVFVVGHAVGATSSSSSSSSTGAESPVVESTPGAATPPRAPTMRALSRPTTGTHGTEI